MRDDAMRKEDVLQLMIDLDCPVTAADLAKHYAKYEYEISIYRVKINTKLNVLESCGLIKRLGTRTNGAIVWALQEYQS